jgi:hypothetical protein
MKNGSSVTIFFKNCKDDEKWRSDIENIFSELYKNDLYEISITGKFKKFISKGFCLNIILEIMKNLRNYGRHGRGEYLKF